MLKNRKFISVLLVGMLVAAMAALAACQPQNTCAQHSDINLDGKCDTCGVVIETQGTTAPAKVDVKLAVFNQYGTAMAEAQLSFQALDGGVPQTVVLDASGAGTVSLAPGQYSLSMENLPEYHIPNVSTVTVTAGMGTLELTVTDNTPNGTAERPFFVGDDEKVHHFAANEELWFHVRSGADRSVVLQHPNIQVTVDGKVLTPDEDGRITIRSTEGDTRDYIYFQIKNLDSSEQDIKVTLQADPGTSQNPYMVEALGQAVTAQVPADGAVCYKFVATAAGTLVLTTPTANSSISMNNMTTYQDTGFSGGLDTISLAVNAGDEILITVSTTGGAGEVEFTLTMG